MSDELEIIIPDDPSTEGQVHISGEEYISRTPDEIALVVDKSSEFTNATVVKTGDSETVESLDDYTNTAVYISNTNAYFKKSVIGSYANNSQGVFCDNYSNLFTSNNSTIETSGDNNPAIVIKSYSNATIANSILRTEGYNSPAIYCSEYPGNILIDSSTLSIGSSYGYISNNSGYIITTNSSDVQVAGHIGKFSGSGEIAFSDTKIESPLGFELVSEDIENKPGFTVRLEQDFLFVQDELFKIKNANFFVSIKDNSYIELENTFVTITNSTGNIIIKEQDITGNIILDKDSSLRININTESEFTGAIPKPEGEIEGNRIRMNLSKSRWNLTADSFLTELIIDDESVINLNGFTLTVGDITSNYEVGYIVNCKSQELAIDQTNLVIIKINEDNTYNLYDTDDLITYNNIPITDITFTARKIDDIQSILEDIDNKAKNSQNDGELIDGVTVVTINESDMNGIRISNEFADHTDITVIKNGNSTEDPATIINTTNNAAVLVDNMGEFIYNSSSVVTNGEFAAGLVVSGEFSVLTANNIEVITGQNNSIGALVLDNGTFIGTSVDIETSGTGSHGVYVDNAMLSLANSNITTTGLEAYGIAVVTLSNDININAVNVDSGDNISLYVSDDSTVTVIGSSFNNTLSINNGSTLNISNSTIETTNKVAYYMEGENVTINNTNNEINVINNHVASIVNAEDSVLVITNDNISNTGNYSIIYVNNSTVDITLEDVSFVSEGLMLEVTNDSIVNLTIAGNITGDITVDTDCTLNVTITGNYTGLINNRGAKGIVNVTIDNGTWTLSTGKDAYIHALTITDNDNTRVIYNGTSRLFVDDESFINRNDQTIDIDSGYSTKLYPTQRTLKVCKSEDLPDKFDRAKDYIYLVYDKMELYVYQSKYTDPFCIVETLPANKSSMTDKMIYITTDGYIYCYYSYKALQLGTVENFDPEQLNILSKCGTTYFMNAESRYIDKQKRTIQLPFQNGNYQLNLSLFEDIMIDQDTVIRFDPETEQFYIAGKEYQFDNKLNNIGKYTGGSTRTVINRIDHHTFRSDIRISNNENNSIKSLSNGLFVSTSDLVKLENYDRMILAFANYKHIIDGYITELRNLIDETGEIISEAAINQKINEALLSYEPTIDEMIARYSNLKNTLDSIEESLSTGLDQTLESAKDEIKDYINQMNSAWSELPDNEETEYSEAALAARSILLTETRAQILALRETTDPEEEHIGSEGMIYDSDHIIPGLSLDESSLYEFILNQFSYIVYAMDNWITVSQYTDLPETGDYRYRYFVINAEDEENPVYQEYQWTEEYDEETGEVIGPAHYELVYDMNA